MRKDYFHVTAVLDRSGSMEKIRDEMAGGFNSYIDTQRRQPGHATCTLVQFDDVYEVLYSRVPLAEVPPRTRENYVPRNMTALYDAMGRAIDETGATLAALPESERPEHVLLMVVTDGLENASHVFTAADVRAKVELQRNVYRWEVMFLGANQDAVLSARELGVPRRMSMTYSANTVGTLAAFDAAVDCTRAYRSGASGQSVGFSAAARATQANAGAHCEAANDPVFDQTGLSAASGSDPTTPATRPQTSCETWAASGTLA